MTTAQQSIEELRAEVARLAGVEPDSKSHEYLAKRLAELRGIATVSFQLTRAARNAVDRVLEAEMPGKRNGRTRMSELIRVALAEYAKKHGHTDEAALIAEALS